MNHLQTRTATNASTRRGVTRIETTADGRMIIQGDFNPDESFMIAQQALDQQALEQRQARSQPKPLTITINASDGGILVFCVTIVFITMALIISDYRPRYQNYRSAIESVRNV